MRRIQIYIDEELDDALAREARRTRRSKAALIRECVSARFGTRSLSGQDPITALIGTIDVDPANIDDVVYGR